MKIASESMLSRAEQDVNFLSQLSETELNDRVKELKLDLERTRMETVWMKSFLQFEAPAMLRDVKKLKKEGNILALESIETKPELVEPSIKFNLCQQELLRIEEEMIANESKHVKDMEALKVETKAAEISAKEFQKAANEFNKFVKERGVDSKTQKISVEAFTKFMQDLSKQGNMFADSIKLTTKTMKTNCRKQKILLIVREELSSVLSPADYELAMVKKNKFTKINGEKSYNYLNLRNDARSATLGKNQGQLKLYRANLRYNELKEMTTQREMSIKKLKLEEKKSEVVIDRLKKSIEVLNTKNNLYEAPCIFDFIKADSELLNLKAELKAAKRRAEMSEMRLENVKQKYRAQLKVNKNYS